MAARTEAPVVGRSAGNVIARHLDGIADLPAPGDVFNWGDVETSHGTLIKLREASLITQSQTGEWVTTRRLAQYCEIRHYVTLGDDAVNAEQT